MITPDNITGLVLAGGRGLRMGGTDKGLQVLAGKPLALHALERLRPQVGALLVNANRNTAAYATFGVPVCPDTVEGFAGPLAGFLAGLVHCRTPWLLTVPCDSPRSPTDLAARLAAAAQAQDAEIAIALAPDSEAPDAALWDSMTVESWKQANVHTEGARALFDIAVECGRSFAALAAATPHLAAVLCQLIDELDGLAYRHHEEGLLPLAGEPFWNQLPWEWPDADADSRPGFEAVAEWLSWITRDAQELWGGLVVTTFAFLGVNMFLSGLHSYGTL